MKKNILPTEIRRIYDGDKWVNFDDYIRDSDGVVPQTTNFFYALFTSQFLNRASMANYDLFSVSVVVFDDIIFLNDFNHYGRIENGNKYNVMDIIDSIKLNDYLDSLDFNKVYYLGHIENHQQLVGKIESIAIGKTTLNPLIFYEWA